MSEEQPKEFLVISGSRTAFENHINEATKLGYLPCGGLALSGEHNLSYAILMRKAPEVKAD